MARVNRFPRNFAFRLTETVAEQLTGVALAHGYRPAEWARRILEEAVNVQFERRAVRLRVQNAALLREYLVELTRQGNNLNQIAHHLNAEQGRDLEAAGSALEALRRNHQRLIVVILDALGAGNDL